MATRTFVSFIIKFLCVIHFWFMIKCPHVHGNQDAKRLYDDLLKKGDYNKLVRPVKNNSDVVKLTLGLRLTQLIDIDEKNQIMTTNVWLVHEWVDYKLKWDPVEYNGVDMLYVPSEEIWLPDIVLYNNADGDYVITLMTKATLHYDGKVTWAPPAIFKSSCAIDVEFFPFDTQKCEMKFGTWSHFGDNVDLRHIEKPEEHGEIDITSGIDMTTFYQSAEWDILDVPARRNIKYYPCCSEPFHDVTFYIYLRRKALFFTINLLVPCVALSFLTVLIFYLPTESGEKTTLCISVLLSLTMFFLLLSDIMPPTSLTIPLLGKYLMFTTSLVCLSILITVIVLNVHCRSTAMHKMSPWTRRIFLEMLPRFLLMSRPKEENRHFVTRNKHIIPAQTTFSVDSASTSQDRSFERARGKPGRRVRFEDTFMREQQPKMSPEIRHIMDNVRYVADQMQSADIDKQIKEDWKYVAMVIDRLFLWIFTVAVLIGSGAIVLQAPSIYDTKLPVQTSLQN